MIIRRVTSCAVAAGAVLLALPAAAQAAGPAAPAASSAPSTVAPVLTFSANPPDLVYDQSVTFTGTDTAAGTGTPVVGQEIDVYAGQGGTLLGSFTTDNAGQFSFTVTAGIGDAADLYKGLWAVAVANAMAAAGTASFTPPVSLDQVNVASLPYTVHAHYGSIVPLSGTVMLYAPGGTATQVSGVIVSVVALGCWYPSDGVCSPSPTYTGTSDSSGNFTVQVPAQFPEEYTVTAGDSPAIPGAWQEAGVFYTYIATDHLPVRDQLIAQETTKRDITSFTSCVHLDEPAGVPVDAQLQFPDLSIQYAHSMSGPWTTFVTSSPRSNGPIGACFYPNIRRPRPGELYYRTTTPADTEIQAGAGEAVRPTPPFQSAVRHLTVTPVRLTTRGRVSVAGRLHIAAGTVPPAHPKIQILFRHGAGKWTVVATVRADLQDHFSARIFVRQSGDIEARYKGTLVIYGCRSKSVHVQVT